MVTGISRQPPGPAVSTQALLGMAERYDVLVTLQDGVFPLVGYAEGKNATALATSPDPPPKEGT